MTAEEWVRFVNQLAAKTKQGRIQWQGVDGRQRAQVGPAGVVEFRYQTHEVNLERRPVPGSLSLVLLSQEGRQAANLTEAAASQLGGSTLVLALRNLHTVLVSQPQEQDLSAFRDALEEL